MQYLMVSVTGLIFFIVGIICLFWPYEVQKFALKKPAFNLGRYNPFLPYMRSKAYIWVLRIIGVFAIFAFLLLLLVTIKGFIVGH